MLPFGETIIFDRRRSADRSMRDKPKLNTGKEEICSERMIRSLHIFCDAAKAYFMPFSYASIIFLNV